MENNDFAVKLHCCSWRISLRNYVNMLTDM